MDCIMAVRDQPAAGKRPRFDKGVLSAPLSLRERRAGYVAALYTAVAFSAIWAPHLGQHVPKGKVSPVESFVIGLMMAGLLAWAASLRRRLALALVALLIGFVGPWGASFLFAFPLIALFAWLTIRPSRLSAGHSGTPAGATPTAGGTAPPRLSRKAGAAAATNRPAPSKRYTPPKVRTDDERRGGFGRTVRREAARRAAARRAG